MYVHDMLDSILGHLGGRNLRFHLGVHGVADKTPPKKVLNFPP